MPTSRERIRHGPHHRHNRLLNQHQRLPITAGMRQADWSVSVWRLRQCKATIKENLFFSFFFLWLWFFCDTFFFLTGSSSVYLFYGRHYRSTAIFIATFLPDFIVASWSGSQWYWLGLPRYGYTEKIERIKLAPKSLIYDTYQWSMWPVLTNNS